MGAPFIVTGSNAAALFTLKAYRGESMVLLAMNWKTAKPPEDFVGFAIQYKEPGGDRFFALFGGPLRVRRPSRPAAVTDEHGPADSIIGAESPAADSAASPSIRCERGALVGHEPLVAVPTPTISAPTALFENTE